MVKANLKCMHCKSEKVYKYGKTTKGTQRLKCRDCGKLFQEQYTSDGVKPQIRLLIVKMSLNGSGIRDISRVLGVSRNTISVVLKKLNHSLQT